MPSLRDSVKCCSVFQWETWVPSTHHNKASDKPETLDFKISLKARTNQSQKSLAWQQCVCVCVCVCVCMCITLLSGMKLTPLYKANFSVEFRQAVFQRLISYCNGHQSTMSERTSNKEKRKTGDCWDSGITYWTRRPRGMSLPHTAYPILAYISNGTVNTIINLQPITPMEHKRQVGRDLAVILRCVSLLCQHTVTQYLTEKLLMQKSFWN